MRHKKSGRKLGRNPSHRKALFRNMATALLINCRITTTEAKAKTLRGVVEPLITLALKNDVHARREAYKFLNDHALVKRLFDVIAPLYTAGGGGYTRVVKLALPRKGDAAPLAIIELIKKPEDMGAAGASAEEAKPAKKGAVKKTAAEDEAAVKAAPKKKAAAAAEGEAAPKKPRAPRAPKA